MHAALARLPLRIDELAIETLARPAAGGGVRRTVLVRLRGGDFEGLGEDVTFQPGDALARTDVFEPLRGAQTLGALWELLDRTDLFLRPPRYEVVRNHRRWAVEAAALDLALRAAGLTLGAALGRAPAPVRFVVSPPGRLARAFPGARLKLDAAELEPELPVDVIDFKGLGDARLARHALALYPHALQEDVPVVLPAARVSRDLGIHSFEDVLRLPGRPTAVNVKPARIGSVPALLALYEGCAREEIALYGGGQHELGPGRAQIQLLASLFHPDAPNDVAPAAYNDAHPPAWLPASPLALSPAPGFR